MQAVIWPRMTTKVIAKRRGKHMELEQEQNTNNRWKADDGPDKELEALIDDMTLVDSRRARSGAISILVDIRPGHA